MSRFRWGLAAALVLAAAWAVTGRQGQPRDVEMVRARGYVITIQGVLEPSWSERLGGMAIAVHHWGDGPITVLAGELVDQAAFHGVLKSLYDLGLPVVSVAPA